MAEYENLRRLAADALIEPYPHDPVSPEEARADTLARALLAALDYLALLNPQGSTGIYAQHEARLTTLDREAGDG